MTVCNGHADLGGEEGFLEVVTSEMSSEGQAGIMRQRGEKKPFHVGTGIYKLRRWGEEGGAWAFEELGVGIRQSTSQGNHMRIK